MSARRKRKLTEPPSGLGRRLIVPAPVAVCLLVLAVTAVYCRTTSYPLVFDGPPKIAENEAVHQLWPPEWLFYDRRPVAYFTFAINHALGGLDVRGYHLVNIAIHAAAASVLFGIVRRTFDRCEREEYRDAASALALCTALLWAVHPLQTQAVTYVVQRIEALMGLLFLATLYGFLRALDSRRPRLWLAVSVVCCYLAAATKEVAAAAPLVVLWYDRAFVAATWWEIIRRRTGYYLALAGSWGMLAFLVITRWSSYGGQAGLVDKLTPWEYLRSQPSVLVHYLRLTLWPRGQCLDYDWQVVDSPAAIVAPGLVIVGLLGLTGWAVFRRPQLSFVGGWFFLILAPTSSVVPIVDLAFEHRMYLPLAAPIALLVVSGFELLRLITSSRKEVRFQPADLLLWMFAPLVVVLICVSHLRTGVYASEESVWRDVAAKAPENPRGYLNLATSVAEENPVEARRCYETALRLDAEYALAHYNFGTFLAQRGELDLALEHFDDALAVWPDHFPTNRARAVLLLKRGDREQAASQFERVLQLDPLDREAHEFLGAYYRLSAPSRAARHFRAAIQIAPDSSRAHTGLAALLWRGGDRSGAIDHYRLAARAAPEDPRMQRNLAQAAAAVAAENGAKWEKESPPPAKLDSDAQNR
ncbi:MAG: tetratricopeptide repeat protein [Pirellulaceae bacterium]